MRFTLVLAVVIVLAGCQGAADPSSPGGSSQAPSTGPASAVPGATSPSVGHAAPDLEARLPSWVGETVLLRASGTGLEVFGDDPWSRSMSTFLASVGRTPADFEFAQAWDPVGTLDLELGAFRVRGISATDLLSAVVASDRAGSPGLTSAATTLAGRETTVVLYPSGSAPLYLVQASDAVLYVASDDENLAAAALAAAP